MQMAFRQPASLVALLAISCGEASVTGSQAADVLLGVTTEQVYTVGSVSGEDWETLSRVANVAFDPSGNLYILDEGAYRVVVVDQEGNLVRTVGREGDGPGELAGPMTSAVLDDGRLVVFDMGLPGAFEVYGPDGSFVTSTTVDILAGTPGQILLPLPDDRLVSTGGMKIRMAGQGEPDEPDGDDHLRDIDVFHLDGSEKEVLYRAWNLPPAEQVDEITATNAEGRREFTMAMQRMRAFTPQLHLATLSDGRVAVVDSVGYRVKLIAPDGTVFTTIGRPIEPEPVTGAIQEAERERRIEAASSAAGTRIRIGGMDLGGEVDAEQLREQMLARIETMIFPDEIPAIADMAVDPEDRIWVARTVPGGDGPIDLMTSAGDYLGTLPTDGPRIPDAFGPGGLMAYIETDEMDVPTVRVVRLVSLER